MGRMEMRGTGAASHRPQRVIPGQVGGLPGR